MSAAGNLYGAQPGDIRVDASSSRSLYGDRMQDDDDDDDDDELGQLEEDDALDNGGSHGTAGRGAQAGPGPSTLAYRGEKKRSASPAASNASFGTYAGTPAKKRKAHGFPRASAGGGAGAYVPPPKPHYTVIRSANNSRSNPHVIRIHPGVTDADESRWPSAEERRPNHKVDGRENWYECQPKDVGRHKSFREKLGDELSKLLKLRKSATESWIVEDLPEHNLFTVHHTFTSGKPRTDVYVFGTPTTPKFRTANEFTPHVYWLLEHGPNDDLKCACKYCSKQKQGDVNRILNLPTKQTASPARSSSPVAPNAWSTTTGPRVKNPPNYAYKPSPLAAGNGGGSGPSSTSSSHSNPNANVARVASFNDPGGERLLGPNASAMAIDKAKRRHMRQMEDDSRADAKDNPNRKGKGNAREIDNVDGLQKKKKRRISSESASSSEATRGDADDTEMIGVDGVDAQADSEDEIDMVESGPAYRGSFTNRMRDEDLEHCSAPRRAELVWAELPRPLIGTKGALKGKVVRHWPGLVMSREVRNEGHVLPRVAASVLDNSAHESDVGTAPGSYLEGEQDRAPASYATGTAGTTLQAGSPPRLSTTASTRFNVRLLAISDDLRLLREEQVLPWLQHEPLQPLFAELPKLLQDAEAVKHIWDGERIKRDARLFDVPDGGEPITLDDALVPLGLAMQIAAHVITTFALNDRYSVTSRFLTPVDPSDPVHRQEREKQLKAWAFQSAHYGAELIWTGDFVRIFDGNGNPFSTLNYESAPISLGKRALFMKVFAIYKENDGPSEQIGLVKLGGELWELREFDAASGQVDTAADTNDVAPGSATTSIGALEGQSAMSMFEKRSPPPPAGTAAIEPSSLPTASALTAPSTPPDTPPPAGTSNENPPGPTASTSAGVAARRASHFVASEEDTSLPPPPAGHYWYRLTSSAQQVHLTIDFLAGRYHPLPKSLNSPATIKALLPKLGNDKDGEISDSDVRALVLAGLAPAIRLFNKGGYYSGDRHNAVIFATENAELEALPHLTGEKLPPSAAGTADTSPSLVQS